MLGISRNGYGYKVLALEKNFQTVALLIQSVALRLIWLTAIFIGLRAPSSSGKTSRDTDAWRPRCGLGNMQLPRPKNQPNKTGQKCARNHEQ